MLIRELFSSYREYHLIHLLTSSPNLYSLFTISAAPHPNPVLDYSGCRKVLSFPPPDGFRFVGMSSFGSPAPARFTLPKIRSPNWGGWKAYSLIYLITQSLPQPAPTSILPHKGGRLLMMNLSWTVVPNWGG